MLEQIFNLSLTGWFILLLVVIISYRYVTRSKLNLPPGPPCLPLLGSLPFIAGDMRVMYAKMAAKYGNVFTIGIGSQRVVILQGRETIKEAFLKSPNAFLGRPDMFDDVSNGHGIVSSQGEVWSVQRRFALHTLRDFGLNKRPMELLVQDEAAHLVDEMRITSETPYDYETLLQKATANVIFVFLLGKRRDYDDAEITKILQDNAEAINLVGANNPALVFKFLRSLPGDIFKYHKGIDLVQGLIDFFRREVEKRKGSSEQEDFITKYLRQIPEWKDIGDAKLFEEHAVHAAGDLYGGGTNSTSHTLLWALLYLTLHQDIQDKVIKEIGEVVGPDRAPNMQDRAVMPYTEAVLSEVHRICYMFPIALPHAAMEDTELCGYTIPKGTAVIANMYSALMDPDQWPQPEMFNPQRFLDDNGRFVKREELINFSVGKRSCPGEGLARMELFLFLTHILQTFTLNVAPDQCKPSTEGILGFAHHPKPFQLVLRLRQ